MKKTLIITAIAALATGSAFGQGGIVFANSTAKPVTLAPEAGGGAVTRGTTSGPFLAELWAAPDTAGNDQQLVFDLTAQRVVGSAGQLSAGFTTPSAGVFSGGNRTVANIGAGAFAYFQVRVWESAYGATYAEAIANPAAQGVGQAGQSIIFRSDTDDPADGAPNVPLNTAFVPFQLSIIPEPSVIGLGLLGAGALLMLRRRK
jgi:hypothetical protein